MKTSNAFVLILVLLYVNGSTEWPTHTVCKEDNLEIHYKSCDPQQDFAFSIDRCSDVATHTFNIRAAMVLRHSIKELHVKVDLIINGKTVLSYSEALCEPGHSKLIFCGKKKGGHRIELKTNLRQFSTAIVCHIRTVVNLTYYIRRKDNIVNGQVCSQANVQRKHLYYEGPVTLGIKEIPQGEYTVSAKLTNEDRVTVACADFTVKNFLDYY